LGALLAGYLRRFVLCGIEFLGNFLIGGFLSVKGSDSGGVEVLGFGAANVVLWGRSLKSALGLSGKLSEESRGEEGEKRTVKKKIMRMKRASAMPSTLTRRVEGMFTVE